VVERDRLALVHIFLCRVVVVERDRLVLVYFSCVTLSSQRHAPCALSERAHRILHPVLKPFNKRHTELLIWDTPATYHKSQILDVPAARQGR
jgi:hypothetical protein